MKKLCFIIPNLKVGGGNRVYIELANVLVNRNCEIEIVHPVNSTDKITFEISPRISIIPIGRYRGSSLGKIWNLILLLFYVYKKGKHNKIFCSDNFFCILYIFLPSKNLYRFIQADDYSIFDDKLILRNDFFLFLYKKLTLLSYRKKINFLFNSNFTYEQFCLNAKRTDVAFRLVHPAINHDQFKNLHIRNGNSKLNICLVARKHPLKGFNDFIRAWKKIKTLIHDKVETVYIISHDDLSCFEIDDFIFIQPLSDSDLTHYLNRSHLFISTSWREGFGLPPLEAMACGCACIISKCGGVMEYARNDENCLMYTPKNIEELVSVILTAVADTDLLKRLSQNAQSTAQKFAWQNSATELLHCIN